MAKIRFTELVTRLTAVVISAYQLLIRPLLPASCRFYPSCSQYAQSAIDSYGLFKGSRMTLQRLLRCHPFHPGGWDPVPAADACRTSRIN